MEMRIQLLAKTHSFTSTIINIAYANCQHVTKVHSNIMRLECKDYKTCSSQPQKNVALSRRRPIVLRAIILFLNEAFGNNVMRMRSTARHNLWRRMSTSYRITEELCHAQCNHVRACTSLRVFRRICVNVRVFPCLQHNCAYIACVLVRLCLSNSLGRDYLDTCQRVPKACEVHSVVAVYPVFTQLQSYRYQLHAEYVSLDPSIF